MTRILDAIKVWWLDYQRRKFWTVTEQKRQAWR